MGRHPRRARPSPAGSRSARSSSTASASMPRSSVPTAASGCGSATGKTGGSTGPARYRDVFRSPDTILVGEELPLPGMAPQRVVAVWLAPPGDMARPVWRDVLERIQLGPEERAECLALGGPETGAPIGSGAGSRPRRPCGGSGWRRRSAALPGRPGDRSRTTATAAPRPGPTRARRRAGRLDRPRRGGRRRPCRSRSRGTRRDRRRAVCECAEESDSARSVG